MKMISSHVENDILTWILPVSVSTNILDLLVNETIKIYKYNKVVFNNIIIDFSQIKYIDTEGALYLICFCSAIKRKNPKTNFHLKYPSEKVFYYLISLGFFGQICNKLGIIDGQDIIHYENEMKLDRRIQQKNYSKNLETDSIILPIETIPKQTDLLNGQNFEKIVGLFTNNALDSLNILVTLPQYHFSGEDYYHFRQSNIELFKNIFHHSES